MKIQVWSDFVCPFCYVGKRHLEKAIQALDQEIEVEFMSFELDQDFVEEPNTDIHQMLVNKYGMSYQEAKANNERVGAMAKAVGLDYNFDAMKYTNTFNAHKVYQFAKLKGKGSEMSEALMKAYFTDGVYLNDIDALVDLGVSVGLDSEGIRNAYESDDFGLKVRQDEQWASMIGARGVPHFVIDDKVSLSGAQPIDTFISAIKHVESLKVEEDESAGVCYDGVCKV